MNFVNSISTPLVVAIVITISVSMLASTVNTTQKVFAENQSTGNAPLNF